MIVGWIYMFNISLSHSMWTKQGLYKQRIKVNSSDPTLTWQHELWAEDPSDWAGSAVCRPSFCLTKEACVPGFHPVSSVSLRLHAWVPPAFGSTRAITPHHAWWELGIIEENQSRKRFSVQSEYVCFNYPGLIIWNQVDAVVQFLFFSLSYFFVMFWKIQYRTCAQNRSKEQCNISSRARLKKKSEEKWYLRSEALPPVSPGHQQLIVYNRRDFVFHGEYNSMGCWKKDVYLNC